VRATRNVPSEVWRIAAEPTDARAAAPSTDTDTVRPFTVPDTALSVVAFDGDVGLPPHAVTTPAARSEAPRHAYAQNSRRVWTGRGLRSSFTGAP
jgi:hypothetical protein